MRRDKQAQHVRVKIGRGILIVTLIILSVIGGVGYFIYRMVTGDVITMPAQPLVAVEGCSTVRVTSNENSDKVTIKTDSRRVPAYSQEIEGNALYIKGQGCFGMTIQVPEQSDLHIIATSGIEVDGVAGEMQLKGGHIILHKVTLQGKSLLESSSNTVHFTGDIEPQSEVTIKSSSSLVNIELPRNSSFHFDLMGGSARSINTTFPEIEVELEKNSDTSGIPGMILASSGIPEMHTQVGTSPQFRLRIETSGSPIVLAGV